MVNIGLSVNKVACLGAVACAADKLHHCAAGAERRPCTDATCAKQSRSHDSEHPTARRALFIHRHEQVHLESGHVASSISRGQVCCTLSVGICDVVVGGSLNKILVRYWRG